MQGSSDSSIIILGAGAAGLMAARHLSRSGCQVTVLEARDRLGGRIHTLVTDAFPAPAELGAEFIHGKLPLTLGLFKEAGIPCHRLKGGMYTIRQGALEKDDPIGHMWPVLLKRMSEQQQDDNLLGFLEREFPGLPFSHFRQAIIRFVEGYDAADPALISIFALRAEWSADDENHQYRPKGGYIGLINHLAAEATKAGCTILTGKAAKHIQWQDGSVHISCADGASYSGLKLIIALPAGVMQAPEGSEGAISFSPTLDEVRKAYGHIGISGVIKVSLVFSRALWKSPSAVQHLGKEIKDPHLILSDAPMPTWWTQLPTSDKQLSGWLAGPRAVALRHSSDTALLDLALHSLSQLFGQDVPTLHNQLQSSVITNWTTDPYTRGAYAYATLGTPSALHFLNTGISNTIFFAGEGLSEGESMGTVEAALESGQAVAERMLGLG